MSEGTDDSTIPAHSHQHFKMYKPVHVLSQFVFNHRKRKNRTLLGHVIERSKTHLPQGIMAIGRLDEDSEGLLLLTTDGKLSKRVREKDVEKEYWVQVNGKITVDAMQRLRKGVEISLPATGSADQSNNITIGESKNAYTTLPCKVHLLETKDVAVTNDVTRLARENSANQNISRKKFKGTCNKCGKSGHKNKDCTLPPINVSSKNSDGISCGIEQKMKVSLPPGILPSSRKDLCTDSRHVTSWISITVTEGKNRQVRRMTAAVGHPTLRLVRVRIGSITLEGMSAGELRNLDQSESNSNTFLSHCVKNIFSSVIQHTNHIKQLTLKCSCLNFSSQCRSYEHVYRN
eukprot:CCRYP_005890-RA/>CCRYP_005890-RA protein AED:0.38 eAED:0.38 QI:289/1/1/1/0/0/2/130/345